MISLKGNADSRLQVMQMLTDKADAAAPSEKGTLCYIYNCSLHATTLEKSLILSRLQDIRSGT